MRAQFYAQFEKKNTRQARLLKTTQTHPREIEGVLVKVTLEIPDAAFEPLEADGVIEAGFVGIPVEVIVTDIPCPECGQSMQAGIEHACNDEEE